MNDQGATHPAMEPREQSQPNKSLRILVVENNVDTLWALRLYLEDSGHEVSTAMNLRGASELLSNNSYDVLISDIGLPDGTGWDLMAKVDLPRERFFPVAMSGFGMNADSAKSRAAGFRHHLLKPFKPDELDKVLAEATAEIHGLVER
jgi:CheY-like chemotaxis protein